MKKKLFALILTIVFVGSFAQTWTVYNTSNSSLPSNFITAISQDNSNNFWIGSYNKISQMGNGGLVKIESNGTQTVYTTSNSQIPSNNIRGIACDGTIIWIASDKGLTRFVGGSWMTYNSSNSGLFYDDCYGVDIDANGNVWVGSWRGISKFDGTNWDFWIAENSNLTDNHIMDITVADNGDIYASSLYKGVFKYNAGDWVLMETGLTGYWDFNKIYQTLPTQTGLITAGFHGVGIYDGTTWTTMDSITTDFPDRTALSACLQNDTVWFTTKKGGVGKYDLVNDTWVVYNTSNSQLPGNWADVVFTDALGNILIGTDEGLVYIDYSTSTNVNNTEISESFKIYPNPANNTLNVEIEKIKGEYIQILDITGKLLIKRHCEQSEAISLIDISNLQNGIYFIKIGNKIQKFIKK